MAITEQQKLICAEDTGCTVKIKKPKWCIEGATLPESTLELKGEAVLAYIKRSDLTRIRVANRENCVFYVCGTFYQVLEGRDINPAVFYIDVTQFMYLDVPYYIHKMDDRNLTYYPRHNPETCKVEL